MKLPDDVRNGAILTGRETRLVEAIVHDIIELCLIERDKSDKKEPKTNGSTMNLDHLMGQSWMANLLARKIEIRYGLRAENPHTPQMPPYLGKGWQDGVND